MTYEETLRYIENLTKFGINLGLQRLEALLDRLGHPEKGLKVIHIGGTNGKGSVLAMLRSVLQKAGYTVGAFISPHLHDYRERITLTGVMIAEEDVVRLINRIRPELENLVASGVEHPTEFEVSTVLALLYFAEKQPDYVLLEVGMGGAIDSTNVVTPLVAVLTSISIDHVEYLGATVEQIAKVKAGIIKKGVPAVTAPQPPKALAEIEKAAAEQNAPLFVVGRYAKWEPGLCYYAPGRAYTDLTVGLRGKHQQLNAAVALTVLEILRNFYGLQFTPADVASGLAGVSWPGRQELTIGAGKRVLFDGAHNADGMATLVEALRDDANAVVYRRKRLLLCLGILADKDVWQVVELIAPLAAKIAVVKPPSPRAGNWRQIAELAAGCIGSENVWTTEDPCAGFNLCWEEAGPEDLICVTGSFYMLAAVRTFFMEMKKTLKMV